MKNINKTRKRSILIENINDTKFPSPKNLNKDKNVFASFYSYEPNRKNRFIAEFLDSYDNLMFESDKILSFNLKKTNSNLEVIAIECSLEIGEWFDNLLKAEVCKLFILNALGEVVNYFDFNITNSGYEYDLDATDDDLFKPKIFYTII